MSSLPKSDQKIDWSKCCLCQQNTDKVLQAPVNSYKRASDSYTSIATNLPQFHELNALLIKLDLRRLDEGEGVEKTLRSNNGKYHKSCLLQLSNLKLERAKKKKI